MNALILGMSSGELLSVDLDAGRMSLEGALEGGILALALSPAGDALAIIAATSSEDEPLLVLMTTSWEVLAEIPTQIYIQGIKQDGLYIYDDDHHVGFSHSFFHPFSLFRCSEPQVSGSRRCWWRTTRPHHPREYFWSP